MSEPYTFSSMQHLRIRFSEITEATNNFDQSFVIGRGGFGKVYRGKLFDGEDVAIKRLNTKSTVGAEEFRKEIELLPTLHHPNIVSLIGYCDDDYVKEASSLVYEYMPNGTLKEHLHELRTHISWPERLKICLGVARGLNFLHCHRVIHRDIRSSNILLGENWVPKISGFGFSKVDPTDEPSIITFPRGAFGYLDPYSLASGSLTTKSDVYSFGVLLLEVLCRRPIVDKSRDDDDQQRFLVDWVQDSVKCTWMDLKDVIDPHLKNEIFPKCLEDFFKTAEGCLYPPKQRPSMAEVVATLEALLTLQELSNNLLRYARSVKEFTFNDLQKATGCLPLGEAGFGDVFLGWVEKGTLAPSKEGVGINVAIKLITSESPQLHDEFPEEVNFIGQPAHPNIIRLLGFCIIDGRGLMLVYECMQKSLPHFIHGGDHSKPLSWGTRLNILIGVARGLKYLHTEKGVLCNFQCDDILLDEDFNAKIGGFGWVEIERRHVRKRLKGVFGYLKGDYDTSNGHLPMMSDVCSFGLVVLETITGKHPDDVLVGLDMQAPKSKLNKKKLKKMMDPRLKDNYSSKGAFKCMALALRCIAAQPEYRPSREEILGSLEQIYALNK